MKRRSFIKNTALATTAISIPSIAYSNKSFSMNQENTPFKISISQWAFEREIFGKGRDNYTLFRKNLETNPNAVLQGNLHPTDIVIKAQELGVTGVDLVATMMYAYRDDKSWLKQFKSKANDHNVQFVCLMTDAIHKVGAKNKSERQKAVEEHKRWIEAGVELGCEHVRVNPYGDGSYLEQMNQCTESLYTLSEFANDLNIKLTVENHGHPGSTGAWLNMLIESVNHPNLGVFLDLGNFFMGGWDVQPRRWYDIKQGVIDLAPYAFGISAKAHEFLPDGNIATIDYDWCFNEIHKHNFKGWVSAEYEGQDLSGHEGSRQIIKKLRKLQQLHSK
jgi:sugar phosphate isomerase/epimerase